MTLQELATREEVLYRKTIELYSQPQSDLSDITLNDIFAGDLDVESENKIIQVLDNLSEDGHADSELIWMLNYYANWPWIFERLESFKGFNSQVVNEQLNRLPDQIDHAEMGKRGQMGKYWNSLTSLRKTK